MNSHDVLLAYAKTALWSSTDGDDDRGLDRRGYTVWDIHPDTRQQMLDDCMKLLDQAQHLLARRNLEPSEVGYDFWLTRNHHGEGFWSRGYGPIGDALTALAHQFPEISLYIGDDGRIYTA